MVVHDCTYTTWRTVDRCGPSTQLYLQYSLPPPAKVVVVVTRGCQHYNPSPDVSPLWCSKYDLIYSHTMKSRQWRHTGPSGLSCKPTWPVRWPERCNGS